MKFSKLGGIGGISGIFCGDVRFWSKNGGRGVKLWDLGDIGKKKVVKNGEKFVKICRNS